MFSSNTTQVSDGGYQISRSLRFNSADSAYLNRTPASAGNRRTWTWSAWIKRSALGVTQQIFSSRPTSSPYALIYFASETLNYAETGLTLTTTQVFRDVSAWYHIVIATDTTQATASDRLKFYVNGVQVTSFSTATYPSQNYDTQINTATQHNLSGAQPYGAEYFSGYMTEVNFIDGQALTPSSFGETNAQTGVWQPKAYSGSYGTNGFYLNFSDNSNTTAATLGKDYSGNGNNWTPNNFSVTAGAGNDSLVDSPTSYGTDTGVGGAVRGNYATWNPLWLSGTFVNGNLDATTATGDSAVGTTFGMSSGKWYAEFTITRTLPTTSGAAYIYVGLMSSAMPASTALGESSLSYSYISQSGDKRNGATITAYGSAYDVNDVIGVAFDADAGSLTFYKNGTSQGTAFSSIPAATYFFGIGDGSSTLTASASLNAGQRPFAYTAPSGFKALCTQNLPTPTIGATTATQAGKYFNPVIYTGNGGTQSVTGVGFQPDFTWVKSRTTTNGNGFEDAVRGAGQTLESNNTSAEVGYSAYFTAFTSDGFNMALGGGFFNSNGQNYVAWNWKANGSGSTNTAGSITSTVSANTTSGFSVLTYTGTGAVATIGHGLGVAPSMVIVKSRSTPSSSYAARWSTYHISLGNTKVIRLESTEAAATASYWNNTTPTSSVFSVDGDIYGANVSGVTYVAYCFAPIAGYSAFGSYTGNADTNGPFIYTGFRPAYVLIKQTSLGVNNWFIYDSTRSTSNLTQQPLLANATDAELNSSSYGLDLLSNGFKIRNTDSNTNQNGQTYIYMALAQNPFKYSLAR